MISPDTIIVRALRPLYAIETIENNCEGSVAKGTGCCECPACGRESRYLGSPIEVETLDPLSFEPAKYGLGSVVEELSKEQLRKRYPDKIKAAITIQPAVKA